MLLTCKSEGDTKTPQPKETNASTEQEASQTTASKTILFFGDSLTAGLGLDDLDEAYPGVIQQKIDSLQLDYRVINSGVSGETTAGGKNRIDWVLRQEPNIFVLELGANDGLRGVPLKETKQNLQAIIDAVKAKYPNTQIVLTGMQIPPNMGQTYTSQFRSIFPELAEKNNIALIPFLLKDVGGIAALNQADGIHPTKEGHKIMARNVWDILKQLLY